MMRMLIFSLALLAWPQTARALCVNTQITSWPATATFAGSGGEYDVYDTAQYTQTVPLTVTTGISLGSCKYYITLSAGSSNNASQRRMARGSDTLDYNAYVSGTTILNPSGSYGSANVISGTFPAVALATSSNISFTWAITPGQVVEHQMTRFEDTSPPLLKSTFEPLKANV